MRKRTERWMYAVIIFLLILNVLAVASLFIPRQKNQHKDLFRDGTLRLETSPAAGTVLAHPHSYVQHGTLVLKGCVQRLPGTALTGGGEVQISLRSPEGEKSDASARFMFPADQTKSCAPFRAEFKEVPRSGTTVLIKWTLSPKPVSSRACGKIIVRAFTYSANTCTCPAPTLGFLIWEMKNEI